MNVKIGLTSDQMGLVKNALKPVANENYIKIIVNPKGNITFATDDIGTVVAVVIPTMDIETEKEATFFIKRKLINRAIEAVKEKLVIMVDETDLTLDIDGTAINSQLPAFDMAIDVEYKASMEEKISSDEVQDMMTRISVSESRDTSMIKVMYLGKQIRYGSGQNFTVIKKAFKSLDVHISPDFVKYIKNIASFGAAVTFKVDNDKEMMVVENDNVSYMTRIQAIEFPDVDGLLESEAEASARFPVAPLASSLNKLSIALMDSKDPVFTMTMNSEEDEDLTQVSVKDVSNKVSSDNWNTVDMEGEATVVLNMDEFSSTISVLEEDFGMRIMEQCVVVEDEKQQTCLMSYS